MNQLKNKRIVPYILLTKYSQLSKLILRMTEQKPEKRPKASEILEKIESEISQDFKQEESSVELNKGKSVEKNQKNNNQKCNNRKRYFSEDLLSIPAIEFKMKNFENKWQKV